MSQATTQSYDYLIGGGGERGRSIRRRSRSRSASASLDRASTGARISKSLAAYRRVSTAQRQIRKQMTGKNAVHHFKRNLYSNYLLASGDNNQTIYIQSGTAPFRVYNTGTTNYINADSFAIEFQPVSMIINWYLGNTLQTTYSYNMPSFTEMTALFDQMQIDWVEIEWFYGTSNSQTTGVTSSGAGNLGPTGEVYGNPMMIYVKDYDDSNPIGANPITQLAQYESQKAWQMTPGFNDARHVIQIKPKFDVQAVNGNATAVGVVSNQDSRKLWLDTTNGINIPHYGIKGCINLLSTVQNTTPANTFILGTLGFRVTYHYKFKNVK